MVPEHGPHDNGFHQQHERACQSWEKRGGNGETIGINGVSPDSRERKMAVADTEAGPPLFKQTCEFLEDQFEIPEEREMTMGTFVTSANEFTIGGFWREHGTGELKTKKITQNP